jgi:membrane protein implicated in regulation of membrane protease activity
MPTRYEYHPGPLQNISPEGLPGFFAVAFMLFGFAYIFVSRSVAEVLFWIMVGVVVVASGFTVYRAIKGRRRQPTGVTEEYEEAPSPPSPLAGRPMLLAVVLVGVVLSLFARTAGVVTLAIASALLTWLWQRRK